MYLQWTFGIYVLMIIIMVKCICFDKILSNTSCWMLIIPELRICWMLESFAVLNCRAIPLNNSVNAHHTILILQKLGILSWSQMLMLLKRNVMSCSSAHAPRTSLAISKVSGWASGRQWWGSLVVLITVSWYLALLEWRCEWRTSANIVQ